MAPLGNAALPGLIPLTDVLRTQARRLTELLTLIMLRDTERTLYVATHPCRTASQRCSGVEMEPWQVALPGLFILITW
jgi:hypothetical protein